jgi:hypothetical protein
MKKRVSRGCKLLNTPIHRVETVFAVERDAVRKMEAAGVGPVAAAEHLQESAIIGGRG